MLSNGIWAYTAFVYWFFPHRAFFLHQTRPDGMRDITSGGIAGDQHVLAVSELIIVKSVSIITESWSGNATARVAIMLIGI